MIRQTFKTNYLKTIDWVNNNIVELLQAGCILLMRNKGKLANTITLLVLTLPLLLKMDNMLLFISVLEQKAFY